MNQLIGSTLVDAADEGFQKVADAITSGAETDPAVHEDILEALDAANQKIDAIQFYTIINLILTLTLLYLHRPEARTTKNVEMVAREVGTSLALSGKILEDAVQFCVQHFSLADKFSAGEQVVQPPTGASAPTSESGKPGSQKK